MKNYIIKFLKLIGFNIVQVRGFIRLQVKNADGSLVSDTGFQENIITNTGLAAFAGLAGNVGSVNPFTYLAVGTDATAASASQTALIAELSTLGLGRASAAVTRSTTNQTNDTLQFDKTWTASGGTTINEIGVFNASPSGVMCARKVTTATPIVSTQLLIATYKIVFA